MLTAFQQRGGDQFGRLLGRDGTVAAKQGAHPWQQGRGAAPVGAHPVQGIAGHRVTEASPVIAQHFTEQIAVVGFQGLGEQAAAVEGVFAQHALAPTVDGRHRGFVHPLRGDVQAAGTGRPLLGAELATQLGDQAIRRSDLVAEEACSFRQACTNSVAQFLGRGVGKGHDQDLRW